MPTAVPRPRAAAMSPERFRAVLRAKGLTQEGAAKLLKVTRKTVVRWACGHTPISRASKFLIDAVILPLTKGT